MRILKKTESKYLLLFHLAFIPKGKKICTLFLIVAGAFSEGHVHDVLYNGESYMECGEVIFVAPNFRSGIFGFLNFDTKDISGNMGLKDILEALRWVEENISAFGGDPKCISVFGFSSGKI